MDGIHMKIRIKYFEDAVRLKKIEIYFDFKLFMLIDLFA